LIEGKQKITSIHPKKISASLALLEWGTASLASLINVIY